MITYEKLGVIAILKTYAVAASTVEDRSRSIALNSGAFALGLTMGPAIQIIFNPIGYPGFHRLGTFHITAKIKLKITDYFIINITFGLKNACNFFLSKYGRI